MQLYYDTFLSVLFSSTLLRNSSSGVKTTGPSRILSASSSNSGSFWLFDSLEFIKKNETKPSIDLIS